MEKIRKKIAIYGAGNYGREVIKILRNTQQIFIEMVCDSDKKKWGKKYEGFVICPPEKIFEEESLDGVFISILEENDIEQLILDRRKIRIFKKINELIAEYIYWDISGNCNAKCKYCVTGRNNRKNSSKHKNCYLDFQSFKNNYKHLYEKGIISKESHLNLFNWKEPYFCPALEQ